MAHTVNLAIPHDVSTWRRKLNPHTAFAKVGQTLLTLGHHSSFFWTAAAVQSQDAVTSHFPSEQSLPFSFAEQGRFQQRDLPASWPYSRVVWFRYRLPAVPATFPGTPTSVLAIHHPRIPWPVVGWILSQRPSRWPSIQPTAPAIHHGRGTECQQRCANFLVSSPGLVVHCREKLNDSNCLLFKWAVTAGRLCMTVLICWCCVSYRWGVRQEAVSAYL